MNETSTIQEFADRVGVAPSALRYYEREGLMPPVARDEVGHRRYDEALERWTRFLLRLRSTGMPIRDVKRYVEALELGPPGDETRMDILRAHRDRMAEEVVSLEACLAIVERKLEIGCRPRHEDASSAPAGRQHERRNERDRSRAAGSG